MCEGIYFMTIVITVAVVSSYTAFMSFTHAEQWHGSHSGHICCTFWQANLMGVNIPSVSVGGIGREGSLEAPF